jgi:pyruvate,orthophosphate dikinase
MPGMFDTVLDLGVDDAVHEALAHAATLKFADDTLSRSHAELRQHGYRRVVGEQSGRSVVVAVYGQPGAT